jgi:hypothetical protein
MKVFMITADGIGSPDSCQIGVASSQKEVLRMVEEWLIKDCEVEELIPDNASAEFLQRLAERNGYWLLWLEHEIDVMNPENS